MRKRLFHFGSQEHRFPRVLFSFNFLQFRWFDMSSRSFRFLYSNFHARSNLSSLFERRETHRVAPKRLSVSVSSELFFSRGGENDHVGSFQSRVKLTVYSKLFETCSKIDLKIRPKVGRLAISSFHYRSMRRLDTFRGVSTMKTFHLLNLKRVYYFAFISLSWLGKCLQIFRETKRAMSSVRTNLKLMRGNRSIGATTVSTDRLTIRSSFHYFAYFSFGR